MNESHELLGCCGQSNSLQGKFEPFTVLRICIAALLLVVEIVALGIAVDTGDLAGVATWWVPLVNHSPQLLQILIATAAVTAICILAGVGIEFRTQTTRISPLVFSACMIANVFAFTLFVPLARLVFAPAGLEAFSQQVLFVTCLGVGLLTALTLALGVFPFTWWKSVLLQSRWALIGATLIGALAWFVGQISSLCWVPLANGTFSLVRIFLSLAYDDLVVDSSQLILGTSRFKVVIAPSCSGYEGLGLVGVFLGVFCYIFRQRVRFPQVLLLFPIGFAVVWLLNSIRIALLIAIGTSWSSEIALGGFHSQAGWIVFNFVALILVLIGTRVAYFVRDENHLRSANVNLTACFLTPFLASIFIGMVVAAVSVNSEAAAFQAICRILVAAALLYLMRENLQIVGWSFTWQSVAMGAAVYGLWIFTVKPASTLEAATFQLQTPMVFSILMLLRFGSYVIVTPIIEELAFRGFVMRRVISEEFELAKLRPIPFIGIAVSSVLFGVFHGQNWFPGVIGGLVYAIAFVRTGQLGDSIAAHATTNGLLAIHAIITRDWAVWS